MRMLLILSVAPVAHVASWSPSFDIAFRSRVSVSHHKMSDANRQYSPESSLSVGRDAAEVHTDDNEDASNDRCEESPERRSFLKSASLSFAGFVSAGPLAASLHLSQFDSVTAHIHQSANAMGLVTFPCPAGSLMNNYHLLRAGESLLEEKGILSTNPLFLTNRDDALTTLGVAQMEDACTFMMANGINPSVVKYSLASKCIDAANIVATRMMIGRNRIIPEFTFMDPRGAGIWDGGPNEAAIWALDYAEAGVEGRDGRPPPNDDGTANETLYEQMIRLRQLMSVLETQFSGDSILLVFPDGSSPALLSALIAGIPLKDTHALNFEPGEVRLDVTQDSTLELFKDKVASPKYNKMLDAGLKQLESLRQEFLAKQAEENAPPAPAPLSKPKTKVETKKLDLPEGGPDFAAASAMAAMASMTMLRKGKEEEPSSDFETEPKYETMPSLAFANAGYTNTTNDLPETRVYYKGPEKIELELPSKEERRRMAEKAMDEYLNRDDGGDDWLKSMKDIMDEESK